MLFEKEKNISSLKNNNFDLLRITLAIVVVLYHFNGLTQIRLPYFILHQGKFAVDSFFIISGFLIYWSFDKNQDLKGYIIKRAYRIFPLLIGVVFVQAILMIILSEMNFSELVFGTLKYLFYNFLSLSFMMPAIPEVFADHTFTQAANGSLWSIKHELLFYIMFPIFYRVIKDKKIFYITVFYLMSVLYGIYFNEVNYHAVLNHQFPAYFKYFLLGMAGYLYLSRIKISMLLWFYIISILSLMIISYYLSNNTLAVIVSREFVYPIFVALNTILIAYLFPKIRIKYDLSYGVYLVHWPIIVFSIAFGLHEYLNNTYLFFVYVLLVVLTLAFLSFKYIEYPAIIRGRNRVK